MSTADDAQDQVIQAANAAAGGLSAIGLVIIIVVITAIAKYRRQLTEEEKLQTCRIDYSILMMLASTFQVGLLVCVEDLLSATELDLNLDAKGEATKAVAGSGLQSLGYLCALYSWLWISTLISCNALLALERLWLVKFGQSISTHVIVAIAIAGTVAYGCIVTAVAISAANGFPWNFGFAPLIFPSRYDAGILYSLHPAFPSVLVLFLIGMSFTPVMAAVLVGAYIYAYVVITNVMVQVPTTNSDRECACSVCDISAGEIQLVTANSPACEYASPAQIRNIQMNVAVSEDVMTEDNRPRRATETSVSTSQTGSSNSHTLQDDIPGPEHMTESRLIQCNGKRQRLMTVNKPLMFRCFVMSAGILLFYLPTWGGIMGLMLRSDAKQLPHPYFVAWTTVLPSLDTIWTPLVILWCQAGYRTIVIRMYRNVIRKFL